MQEWREPAMIRGIMSQLHIELPESILVGSGQSRADFLHEARFLLLAKLFEIGRVSSGKAAHICGMNRVDFLFAIGRLGIPVVDLDDHELENELGHA
jgi:predicted HTH domain antitoxin